MFITHYSYLDRSSEIKKERDNDYYYVSSLITVSFSFELDKDTELAGPNIALI